MFRNKRIYKSDGLWLLQKLTLHQFQNKKVSSASYSTIGFWPLLIQQRTDTKNCLKNLGPSSEQGDATKHRFSRPQPTSTRRKGFMKPPPLPCTMDGNRRCCCPQRSTSKDQSGEPHVFNDSLLSDPNDISFTSNTRQQHMTCTVLRRLLST